MYTFGGATYTYTDMVEVEWRLPTSTGRRFGPPLVSWGCSVLASRQIGGSLVTSPEGSMVGGR